MKKKKTQNLYNLIIKEKKIFFIITVLFFIIGLIIDKYQKINSPKLYTITINTYSSEKYNKELDKIFKSINLKISWNLFEPLSSETTNILEYDKTHFDKILMSQNIYKVDSKKKLLEDDKKFYINDFYFRLIEKDKYLLSYKSKKQLPDNKIKNILGKVEKLAKERILNENLKSFLESQNEYYEKNSIQFKRRIKFLNYHLSLAKKLGIETSNFYYDGIEYFKNGYKSISIELKALQSINPEDSGYVFYQKESMSDYLIGRENLQKFVNRYENFIKKIEYFKEIQKLEPIQINPDKKFTIPFTFSGFFISFFIILFRLQKD